MLSLYLSLPVFCPAQAVNLGTPPIWNYSRKAYSGGTQSWDAAADRHNRIYWANNDGLLQYDGTRWTLYPAGNRTIVRSVAIDPAGRIYAGAQSDFGYFEPDDAGRLRYTSLVHLLPEGERSFEDVWDIVFYENHVFFSTHQTVFQYDGVALKTHSLPKEASAMFATPYGLFIQLAAFDSLFRFSEGRFKPFVRIDGLDCAVTGAMKWNADTILLSTLKQGIYYLNDTASGVWTTSHDRLLMDKRIYSSTLLPGNRIALGTSLDGLIVIDAQRRIYRHLTKKDGLQNNNILHTFCDRAGNLWLGLNNGIDCVVLDSPFSYIFPDGDLKGTGYSAALHDGRVYLGVSNGAYVTKWQPFYDTEKQPFFQQVQQSEGQVWGFAHIDGNLLMGHHEGAFHIRDDIATPISAEPGTWTYLPLDHDYLLAGSYGGLSLYRMAEGRYRYEGKINGLNESCRIMVRDRDGAVWVSHPYRGLYHVHWSPAKKLDPEIAFYDQSKGLPSNFNNYVFSIAGKAVFGTEKGVYRFDPASRRFTPDPEFDKMFGSGHRVKYMREDMDGHIWYVTDQEAGVLHITDHGLHKDISKQVFPELEGKLVGGFESIYPVDPENIIFGSEEGFILYRRAMHQPGDTLMQVVWSSIRAQGKRDTLLFGGYGEAVTRVPVLQAGINHLTFSYSSTEFKSPALVRYRTMLEGQEDEWSAWSGDTRRHFTNLGPGRYTFRVQAGIKDVRQSEVISYSFRIRPPWFKSTAALTLYFLGVMGFFTGYVMRQRNRFESEKERLTDTHRRKEEKHIREVEESKAALTEIQNEKLEVEIKYKNQELALTTMHLVQKAEILLTVQEALNQIKEKSINPDVKKDVQQLLNLLNFDVKLDEDWEHFAHHFDQVHVDFLKTLREHFPQLSANDCKLCAYLRMNLTTKEIAPLMNISVRGVEGSRYRLRKKLNLPNDANLTEFILGLGHGA